MCFTCCANGRLKTFALWISVNITITTCINVIIPLPLKWAAWVRVCVCYLLCVSTREGAEKKILIFVSVISIHGMKIEFYFFSIALYMNCRWIKKRIKHHQMTGFDVVHFFLCLIWWITQTCFAVLFFISPYLSPFVFECIKMIWIRCVVLVSVCRECVSTALTVYTQCRTRHLWNVLRANVCIQIHRMWGNTLVTGESRRHSIIVFCIHTNNT